MLLIVSVCSPVCLSVCLSVYVCLSVRVGLDLSQSAVTFHCLSDCDCQSLFSVCFCPSVSVRVTACVYQLVYILWIDEDDKRVTALEMNCPWIPNRQEDGREDR